MDLEAVHRAIDTATVDEAARPRLRTALPMLEAAVDDWGGPAPGDYGLVLTAATPRSAIVLLCEAGWLIPDAGQAAALDRGQVATAVLRAVESGPIDVIAMGLSVLLGTAGIAAQIVDATKVVRDGGHPLCVELFDEVAGAVSLVITTVAIGARVLH